MSGPLNVFRVEETTNGLAMVGDRALYSVRDYGNGEVSERFKTGAAHQYGEWLPTGAMVLVEPYLEGWRLVDVLRGREEFRAADAAAKRLAQAEALLLDVDGHLEHDENNCDRDKFCDAPDGCVWHKKKCPECTCRDGALMERVREFVRPS